MGNPSITAMAERIVLWPVERLQPYARNSRTHSDEQVDQIAASIREFGFTNPILVDSKDGIIAGHGRLMAAKRLNLAQVPVIVLDHLTDQQRRAYIIADNKLALNAGWDNTLLAEELMDLQAEGYDVELTGFSDEELADLLEDVGNDNDPGGTQDDEAVPEVEKVHVTQHGDVWKLGTHRLMCGDSTKLADVQKLMDGTEVDLVWTDPPYNVAVEGKAGKIMNDDMGSKEFRKFLRSVYDCYYAVMKPGAVIYVAHGESERAAFADCMIEAGLKMSQVLIWVKQSATLSRQDFNWQHEPILYGWKEGSGHYFCGDFTRTTVIDDDLDLGAMTREQMLELLTELKANTMTSIVRHDRPTKSDLHPTMKPVALVERMVKWSSRPGQAVLDLFGGSGSTLIACEKTARINYSMELDPKFADVIVRRWQEYTGQKAVLANTGEGFDAIARLRGADADAAA